MVKRPDMGVRTPIVWTSRYRITRKTPVSLTSPFKVGLEHTLTNNNIKDQYLFNTNPSTQRLREAAPHLGLTADL